MKGDKILAAFRGLRGNGIRQTIPLMILTSLVVYGTAPAQTVRTPQLVSANGQFVAFASYANDLVENDNVCLGKCDGKNGLRDIFVRDLGSNTTILVSINRDGSSSGNQVGARSRRK